MTIKKYIFIFFIFAALGIASGAEAATFQVTASADDVARSGATGFNNTLSSIFVGNVSATGINNAAMRFTGINIPQGSTINSAVLTMTVSSAGAGTAFSSKVYAEATDTAIQITSYTDFDARLLTSGTPWTSSTTWTLGDPINSPDISSEIQAVINRAGWASNNAINIFWKDNGSAVGNYRFGASFDNTTYTTKPSLTITWTAGVDTTAPARSNGLPTGTLAAGTTQTNISLTTNESATCRYSVSAGISYASMTNNFSTTGATSHSTLVTGLANGQSYTYYIKCSDAIGNANTDDFTISFSIASPAPPDPTPPVISSLATSNITSNSATITWTTDDLSTSIVNYGTTVSLGSSVSSPSLVTSHSINLSGLSSNTTYYYQVRSCNSDNYCSNSSTIALTTSAPVTGNSTNLGTPTVVGLTRLITIQAPYTNDNNANNFAVFQYKKTTDNTWLDTFPMYVDRANKIWHGVSYGLETDTNYDIRVVFTDADGVAGSPWTGTKQTKKDGTRPLGTGPVYWIDGTNGNDTTGNGSQGNPWKTINRSVSSLAAGVTVRIKAGIYREQVTVSRDSALGSVGNPITFESAPGETVIIDGEFTRTNGINIGRYDRTYYDFVIRGLTVRNTTGSNIIFGYSQYLTVEDSILEEARFGPGAPGALEIRDGARYLIFRRNTVTNTGAPTQPGTWRTEVSGVVLRENTGGEHSIYSNTFQGGRYDDAVNTQPEGSTYGWVRDSEMYGNTIIDANDDGWQIDGGAARSVFWNNTVINAQRASISVAPIMAGPTYVFRNLFYNTNPINTNVAVKAGSGSPGKIFFVHNTWVGMFEGITRYGGQGWTNHEYYNNIISVTQYYIWGLEGGNKFNYNLAYVTDPANFVDASSVGWGPPNPPIGGQKFSTISAWQAASGEDANSIQANPLLDSAYKPLSNSPAIDKAYYYPQVGDPFSDTAPDIGTFEYGIGGPDSTPPGRSNISPAGILAPGTTQAILSLSTNESATCRYSTTAGTSYSSMTNNFSTTGGTSHSTAIPGLADGNTYNYYVRCQDSAQNPNTTDSQITFSVTVLGDISSAAPGVRDGKVDIYDVSRMLSKWGSTNAADLAEADINPGPGNISQGRIDLYDANKMMVNWRP